MGEKMKRDKNLIFAAALLAASFAGGASAAFAQTFQNYRCADGTQFIVGFYQYDSHAYLQVDGGTVTLAKRLVLSGSRYSGRGITLKMTKGGVTTLKHARRPVTACELT
jgi:membrane-bound inhibitor of C-type lysozyme